MSAANVIINDKKVDKSLDCVGDLCPLPVYKASRALGQLEPGQVLELRCDDPGSLRDIPALARQARHELLAVDEADPTVQVFYLRKGGAK